MRNCFFYAITSYAEFRPSGIPDDVITLVQKFDFRTNIITRKYNGTINGITVNNPEITERTGITGNNREITEISVISVITLIFPL